MDKQLLLQLEQLRNEMVETAISEKNLLHRDVLVLSQSLDEIIVQVQSERRLLARTT
ncbi:aspartyl-phosphate phosphatase Spo0E family protein [Paenibacillus paeoniae]|uniref:Aspartyl-phosphate phosphatase Spo0E family protein n=1 Tax=Paenibacillus paeoniae TaxID=2292705 RepID=A0A371PM87_9BACL|nr:aspartyl-phosphate phosphatase Spo0E family protein [Paenibacillus paeoniae]REK77314.1 aspartyl-phosphate phosphatase Spo0E family protein [Paenibacillus paeoniae]